MGTFTKKAGTDPVLFILGGKTRCLVTKKQAPIFWKRKISNPKLRCQLSPKPWLAPNLDLTPIFFKLRLVAKTSYLVTEKIGTEFIKGKISNKPIRCQVSPQTLLAPNFSNEDW